MIAVQENVKGEFYNSQLLLKYFKDLKMVVADIETTGLSPKYNMVMLGGLVTPSGENREILQFFAASEREEAELLDRYVSKLQESDVVITYNGSSFDLPFIKKRMLYHGMDASALDRLYSMDLYRIVKYHSVIPNILPDLKQKSLEIYLGNKGNRTDTISGAENIELYNIFKKSKGQAREDAFSKIMLHNRDDIVGLSEILNILKSLNLDEIIYSEGIPLKIGKIFLKTLKPKLKDEILTVAGRIYGNYESMIYFGDGYKFFMNDKTGEFTLNIYCRHAESVIFCDVEALEILSDAFIETDMYKSGYLVLKKGKVLNYKEINLLIKNFLLKMLN